MLKRTFKLAAVILSAMILMMACSDKSAEPKLEDQPPALPSENTMNMPFDDFAIGATQQLHKTSDTQFGNNWLQAATMVVGWRYIAEASMLVPRAALGMARSQNAVYQDGQWVWSYDFSNGVTAFNITFTAGWQAEQSQWAWAMYFTNQDVFQNFKWFDGISAADGSNGSWTFYQDPENPAPGLSIDWQFADGDTTPTVRFTNIDTSGASYGSYIEFGPLNDANYNAYFTLYDAATPNTVNIQWHRQNKNGRIKNPAYFNDSNWHCWDTFLNDVDCPQ